MALFFVEHRHTAETCPTRQPEMMAMLGKHVTQATADGYGIKIHADVVHPGEHWMNLVLEADSQAKVEEYVAPFGQVGSVSVKQVSTCEEVVRSAVC
ncbi:MAG: DUF3303 family protein [Dehalococcoidia bacterium]